MELDGDEKKTLFLGNIPEHYGEADVAAAFGEHGCPTPWKVVLRPGYRGAQFGFAYFNQQSDCLQILEQNSMADSFITWDTGSWALIKKAKPKPKAASRPTTVAPPPKMPVVVVPPPMLLPIPPPPPVPAPQVPRVLTPHRPQDPRVRKTPPWALQRRAKHRRLARLWYRRAQLSRLQLTSTFNRRNDHAIMCRRRK